MSVQLHRRTELDGSASARDALDRLESPKQREYDAAPLALTECAATLGASAAAVQRLDSSLVQFRRAARAHADPADVHAAASRGTSGGGSTLPHLHRIQASFGDHDVSGVSAHVGGPAAEACETMGAAAYASGDAVAFKTSPSLHTAAHEAAHVVQQRVGVALKDGVGRSGDVYEQHADAVADKVVRGESAQGLLDQMAGRGGGSSAAGGAVQGLFEWLTPDVQGDVKTGKTDENDIKDKDGKKKGTKKSGRTSGASAKAGLDSEGDLNVGLKAHQQFSSSWEFGPFWAILYAVPSLSLSFDLEGLFQKSMLDVSTGKPHPGASLEMSGKATGTLAAKLKAGLPEKALKRLENWCGFEVELELYAEPRLKAEVTIASLKAAWGGDLENTQWQIGALEVAPIGEFAFGWKAGLGTEKLGLNLGKEFKYSGSPGKLVLTSAKSKGDGVEVSTCEFVPDPAILKLITGVSDDEIAAEIKRWNELASAAGQRTDELWGGEGNRHGGPYPYGFAHNIAVLEGKGTLFAEKAAEMRKDGKDAMLNGKNAYEGERAALIEKGVPEEEAERVARVAQQYYSMPDEMYSVTSPLPRNNAAKAEVEVQLVVLRAEAEAAAEMAAMESSSEPKPGKVPAVEEEVSEEPAVEEETPVDGGE